MSQTLGNRIAEIVDRETAEYQPLINNPEDYKYEYPTENAQGIAALEVVSKNGVGEVETKLPSLHNRSNDQVFLNPYFYNGAEPTVKLGNSVVIMLFVESQISNDIRVIDYSRDRNMLNGYTAEYRPRSVYTVSIYNKSFIEFMTEKSGLTVPGEIRQRQFPEVLYEAKIDRNNYKYLCEHVLGITFDSWYVDGGMSQIVILADKDNFNRFFDQLVINGETTQQDTDYYRGIYGNQDQLVELDREKVIDILNDMHMYEFIPTELPYDYFDNNIGDDSGDHHCIIRMLLNKYGNSRNKGGWTISSKNIINYFKKNTFRELFDFCKQYKIRINICDVFGNKLIKEDFSNKDAAKKNTGRPDLNLMYFNRHGYPYISKKSFDTRFNLSVTKYNDNLYMANALQPSDKVTQNEIDAMGLFRHLFTDNFNYRSEDQMHVTSLRIVRNDIIRGNYADVRYNWDDPAFAKLVDIKNIKSIDVNGIEFNGNRSDGITSWDSYKFDNDDYGVDDYCLFELDMRKAFYNCMMTIDNGCNEIPVFSVESVIQVYDGSGICKSDMYFLSKESIDRKELYIRGISSNVHHGFVINYLLSCGYIKKNDITHVKKHTSTYNIYNYRKDINELFKDNYMGDFSELSILKSLEQERDELYKVMSEWSPEYSKLVERKKQLDAEIDNITPLIDSRKLTDERINDLVVSTINDIATLQNTPMDKTEKYKKLRHMKSLLNKYNKMREYNDTLINGYMLYDGVMGRKYAGGSAKVARMDGKCDDDNTLNLLRYSSKNVERIYKYDDDGEIAETLFMSGGHKYYLYFNNRNIYDYCLSSCNLFMLRVYDDFVRLNPLALPVRVYTDCITFLLPSCINKINLNEPMHNYMRFKNISVDKIQRSSNIDSYIDVAKILEEQMKELDDMASKVTSYTGGPGTGKTYKVKNDHKGNYHYGITVSNICARNMDTESIRADTIYSKFQLHKDKNELSLSKRLKAFYNKTIWFDEFSMFKTEYFNYIYLLTHLKNANILLTGDMNQIGPIFGSGVDMDNIFYRKLFGNNTELKENHRVKKVLPDGTITIDNDCKRLLSLSDDILANINDPNGCYLRLRYEVVNLSSSDLLAYKIHLVYTIKMKNMINNYIFDKCGYKFSLRYINKDKINVVMSKGLRLIVNEANKGLEVYKSVVYEVLEDINRDLPIKDNIEIRNITSGKDNDYIKVDMLHNLVIGFAVTIHSSQGMTIREKTVIHQPFKMVYHDPKILYTGITRMTKRSDLSLMSENFEYSDISFRSFKLNTNNN